MNIFKATCFCGMDGLTCVNYTDKLVSMLGFDYSFDIVTYNCELFFYILAELYELASL